MAAITYSEAATRHNGCPHSWRKCSKCGTVDLTDRTNWTKQMVYIHRSRLVVGIVLGVVIGVLL